jgi:hypothetical protein
VTPSFTQGASPEQGRASEERLPKKMGINQKKIMDS